jgi:urease accessory protein
MHHQSDLHSGWPATLQVRLESDQTVTRLVERRHSGPLQIQKPLYPEGPKICHLTILHPPGGLAEGDDLDLRFELGESTHTVIATPAATKWYKTPTGSARQRVSFHLKENAKLEWLPQENIIFDRSHAQTELTVTAAENSILLGWDMFSLGRRAAGETWKTGTLKSKTQLACPDGTLMWAEQASLSAGWEALKAGQILSEFPVFGTLWARSRSCTPELSQQLDCPFNPGIHSGATCLPGNVLLVRALSYQIELLRNTMINWWVSLRSVIMGVSATPLRIWST